MPLEANTVRYIDNFSVGSRGSASAEYFLKQNYAVIYLYRIKSLTPFERHFKQTNVLDVIRVQDDSNIRIDNKRLIEVIKDYNEIKSKNKLLEVSYETIFDYLTLFRFISCELNVFKDRALVYLAAAVSDFYIPFNKLPKHKIQSNVNGLNIELKPVPKLLGKLKESWCSNAFIISFKLETDVNLLEQKCKLALNLYKHDLVVGNLLNTRKNHVVIYSKEGHLVKEINLNEQLRDLEIEQPLVDYLTQLHTEKLSS